MVQEVQGDLGLIPVMGVPILNRPELLDGLVKSADDYVRQWVVVDNGDVIDRASDFNVIHPGCNLGVAASWNLIIKTTPRAEWWCIVNSDIEFGEGALAALAEAVDPQAAALYHLLGFAAFAITPAAVEKIGFFDENFHPAYCEDIDYSRRANLAGVPRITVPAELKHLGSATIYGDDHYMSQNGYTYPRNVSYYEEKWGGPMHGGETFVTPFNEGGDIRDIRVDISRLNDLAWQVAKP